MYVYIFKIMGRDSSVSVATCTELDGLGIESRLGRNFPHSSRPALGPTQPPIQWVPGLSRGVKRPGRGVDHPPPSSADVKERVQLYPYIFSGTSWFSGIVFSYQLQMFEMNEWSLTRFHPKQHFLNYMFSVFTCRIIIYKFDLLL